MNKINFSKQTVTVNTSIPFAQMGALEDALQMAALEYATSGDATRTTDICELAETLGVEISVDDLDGDYEGATLEPVLGSEGNEIEPSTDGQVSESQDLEPTE